jgi:thermitase
MSDTSTISFHGTVVRSIYVNQPAASIIKVPDAQTQYGAGTGIVAIIDTGIDPNHPALAGNIVPGYDFLRKTAGIPNEWLDLSSAQVATLAPTTSVPVSQKTVAAIVSSSAVPFLDQSTVVILDGGGTLPAEFGHGTMVAGLIHLVAPGAKIMPLKAFQSNGTANLSDVEKAIRWAVNHGASVINMSFSVVTNDPKLQSAIQDAASKGVICVASSGNDGAVSAVYPAAYPTVIGVGSVNNYDLRSVFSNYGSMGARTSAPGEALITTYPGNNYAGVWGTSFSTALVSGAAAMALQVSTRGAGNSLYYGQPIDQNMGDTRLQILDALSALGKAVNTPHP